MTDSNSPISQKINSLIQEIETGFQAIKAAKGSELAPKLNLANASTGDLRGRIQGKVDDPELNNAIAKTADVLANNKPVVKDEIETLKQENEALASALPGKLQQLNLPEPDLSELTTAIQNWLNEINKILEDLRSISEFNQTTDSILLNIKDKFTQLSQIFESEGTLETLLCEIKAEMKKIIEEPNLTDFSKKIDDLATEQKPVESILAINLHLDKLIQEIKPKVSTNVDLSQEVQEELAKLIILAGKAQVEVAKVQVEVEKAQVEVEKAQEVNVKADTKVKPKVIKAALKAKDSSSNRIAQIKAVSGYLEIAIDALIGTPYLPLARKLQFESKSRLRGSWGQVLNIGDTFYSDVKVPTKVVLGVILSFPISLAFVLITGVTPIKPVLLSLLPTSSSTPTSSTSSIPSQSSTSSSTSTSSTSSTTGNDKDNSNVFNFIALIFMTGTLGGAISILYRLKEFDDTTTQKYDDAFLPYLIGMIKPIVGGSFAFFIFILLNSSVSPLTIRDEKGTNGYTYGLLALAFIAGFSERFALNLITQTEQTVTSTGLPSTSTALAIDPSTALLNYGKTQLFTLSNASLSGDNYDITLSPVIGTYMKNSTSAFVYAAPTTKGDGVTQSTVTITVKTKTDPIQSAIATVTLI